MTSTTLRRVLVALALAAGMLAMPVATAPVASAAPCPTLPIPLPIPLPCLVPPAATTPVAVTGVAKVGSTLTATPPTWDQTDITTTYQWNRDGEPISGATTETYQLVGEDFEAEITVVATGTGALPLLTGTSTSTPPVNPTIGDPIKATKVPMVTGSNTVGSTLTTTSGEWGEPTPTFTYQWYRSKPSGTGAVKIDGATATTYKPVAGDAGRKIVALVTADRFGYQKGAAISNLTGIPRTSSTTTLTLIKNKVRPTDKAAARIVLGSGAGLVPAGVITVFDGTKKIRTVKIAAPAGGVANVTLPPLKVGQHQISATFAGDFAHTSSSSVKVKLTVAR